MAVRIVTDSTCDLPAEIAAEHGIIVVPTCIGIGDRSYLDGIEITREEFYDWLPTLIADADHRSARHRRLLAGL